MDLNKMETIFLPRIAELIFQDEIKENVLCLLQINIYLYQCRRYSTNVLFTLFIFEEYKFVLHNILTYFLLEVVCLYYLEFIFA